MPDLIKTISTPLETGASVDHVYGEPIRVGDRLIVPVARVAYAYARWDSAGVRESGQDPEGTSEATAEGGPAGRNEDQSVEKSGARAMAAAPAGVLEITEDETSFIPFFDYRPLLAAGLVGLALGLLLGRAAESD